MHWLIHFIVVWGSLALSFSEQVWIDSMWAWRGIFMVSSTSSSLCKSGIWVNDAIVILQCLTLHVHYWCCYLVKWTVLGCIQLRLNVLSYALLGLIRPGTLSFPFTGLFSSGLSTCSMMQDLKSTFSLSFNLQFSGSSSCFGSMCEAISLWLAISQSSSIKQARAII